jgi:cell division control protein 45
MLWPSNKLNVAFRQIKKSSESCEDTIGGLCTLILSSIEADSVCACQLIVEAFKSEDITYSLKPVRGFDDVSTILTQRLQERTLKSVILINCGGTIDLTKHFGVDLLEGVYLYVIDSHRPLHHGNLHGSSDRVVVFGGEIETLDETIPEESDDDLIESDEEEEEEENEEQNFQQEEELEENLENLVKPLASSMGSPDKAKSSRQQSLTELTNRKRLRRQRVDQYYSSNFIGDPASTIVFSLLQQLGKATNIATWFAIVGITSRYIAMELDDDTYYQLVEMYREIVLDKNPLHKRIRKSLDDKQTNVPTPYKEQIEFVENEINLVLYKHCSLAEACYNTEYFAARFGAWNPDAGGELEHFFAKLGLSLRDASQKFNFMSRESKFRVKDGIKLTAEQFQFKRMTFPSFSFRSEFDKESSADDIARFITALLDGADRIADIAPGKDVGSKHDTEGFSQAFDILGKSDQTILNRAQNLALKHASMLTTETIAIIQSGLVQSAGEFRWAHVELQEDDDDRDGAGTARALFFYNPVNVVKLAKHIINANQGNQKWVQHSAKPLVLAVSRKGKALITGLPCPKEVGQVFQNPFGRLFAKTAREINIDIDRNKYLDSFVVEINSEDVQRFLLTLTSLFPEG